MHRFFSKNVLPWQRCGRPWRYTNYALRSCHIVVPLFSVSLLDYLGWIHFIRCRRTWTENMSGSGVETWSSRTGTPGSWVEIVGLLNRKYRVLNVEFSRIEVSGFWTKISGSWLKTPGSRTEMPGFWMGMSGFWTRNVGFQTEVPGVLNRKIGFLIERSGS